jgi:hypothetical protein
MAIDIDIENGSLSMPVLSTLVHPFQLFPQILGTHPTT